MTEEEFHEKVQDPDFWDRYAKSPEEKKKYFFVGQQVISVLQLLFFH